MKSSFLAAPRALLCICLFWGLILSSGCKTRRIEMSQPMGLENPFWNKDFSDLDVLGTFVCYDPGRKHWEFHNKARADSVFSPASTFKIFNSLVGLQEKAVANDSVVLPWDKVERGWENWDMDQNMKTAFKYSCVWYYQEIARRVGRQRMDYWLHKVGYGNREMGATVDSFWLDGSLQISAIEQVAFIYALEANYLPFPIEVQENVKRIMLADEGKGWKLYGKTGWGMRGARQVGWYVGFVHSGDEKRIFAMNMDIVEDEDAQYRLALTRKILAGSGLIDLGE